MDSPLVSIIVTTYNYAHTVGTAIDSALRQDYPNLEVIVVDNASTDGTPELAARYAGDPRFRYIRNPENIGMVPNHNKGLVESRGSYVLFLSADDFLMPHHVSRSYAYLHEHPEIDVLYTATYFVDEGGTFIGHRQMTGQPLAPYAGGRNELAGLLIDGCYMCFPTMLMRRDLYDRFGLLDEAIKAADYEIVIRWAAAGVRFAYLPEPTCAVRLHSNQQSSAQNYVADAGDIREFIYLVKRFCGQNAAQLDGFESSISRHMWGRFGFAQQSGVRDDDGSIKALMLECDGILAAVRSSNIAVTPRRLRPTVIVLPGMRINEVERTLRSLVEQTLTEWDAIAMEYGTKPYAGLGEYLDPQGRIRTMRLVGEVTETMAINQALRIAGGDLFVVLHAGSVLVPEHLERIVATMRAHDTELVRTSATYGGRTIYMPPSESRLTYVMPYGTIDALAFTRRVLDLASGFNEAISPFANWEFYLRAGTKTTPMGLDSPVALPALPPPETYGPISSLPGLARQIHAAYATPDASIAADRAAYLHALDAAVAAGIDPLSTPEGHVRLVEAAYGTRQFAVAR